MPINVAKPITIIIAGGERSGKSTIAAFIGKMLEKHGINNVSIKYSTVPNITSYENPYYLKLEDDVELINRTINIIEII